MAKLRSCFGKNVQSRSFLGSLKIIIDWLYMTFSFTSWACASERRWWGGQGWQGGGGCRGRGRGGRCWLRRGHRWRRGWQRRTWSGRKLRTTCTSPPLRLNWWLRRQRQGIVKEKMTTKEIGMSDKDNGDDKGIFFILRWQIIIRGIQKGFLDTTKAVKMTLWKKPFAQRSLRQGEASAWRAIHRRGWCHWKGINEEGRSG